MLFTRLILGCGLGLGLLLCSCGDSQEPPPRHPNTLGDTPYGAPTPTPRTDTGILRDQATYQPAAYSGDVGAGRGREGAGGVTAADAAGAAGEMVKNLLNDLEDGEVDWVLDALDGEQIKVLRDDNDETGFLYNTQERYTSLTNGLATELGDSSVTQLNSDLRKLVTDALAIDVVDPTTVTVTPNPLLIIFGPEKTAPTMTIARKEGEWRIRLDAPLTEDDLAQIRAYHEKLQQALDALIDAVYDGQIESREAIQAALIQAAMGREVDLAGIEQPDEGQEVQAEEDESPEEEPKKDEGPTGPVRPVGP